jgi:hypothetical protein
MNCDKSFDRYLSLDKNARVPLPVTLHLLVCSSCRTEVRSMTRAEEHLASPLGLRVNTQSYDPGIMLAMERIAASGLSYAKTDMKETRVSLLRWLVSGLALIAGFAIVPFTAIGIWSSAVLGNAFSVPFYILCGVAVTGYCGMFVGTNIDFFVKKFGIARTI